MAKEFFGIFVDSFDFRNQMGVLTQLICNFFGEMIYDIFNSLMLEYHFLVVTFGLVRVSGLEKLGHVSENPQALPFLFGFKGGSKI